MGTYRLNNARICLKRMTYNEFYDKVRKEDKSYYRVSDGVYIDRDTWETVLVYDPINVISKYNISKENPAKRISNEFNIWDKIIDFN